MLSLFSQRSRRFLISRDRWSAGVGAVAVTLALPVAEALHGQQPETARVKLRVDVLGAVDTRFPAEVRVGFLEAATGTHLASASAETEGAVADLLAEVPLPAVGQTWEVSATADGWWGPRTLVSTDQTELNLVLAPAGMVRLELAGADRGIDELDARDVVILGGVSRGSKAAGALLDPGIHRGSCQLERAPEEVAVAVLCPFALGPVAALEVLLGPFVPFRQSDVSVAAGMTPTLVEAVRGGSLVGRFLDDERNEASRFALRSKYGYQTFSRSAWTDSFGSFGFGGLQPGEYELRRIGSSETWTVAIGSLHDTVDLGDLYSPADTRLVVALATPFFVETEALTMELQGVTRAEDGSVYRRGRTLEAGSHDAGEWTWSGLSPGSWELQIGDEMGNRLAREPIEFRGSDRVIVEMDAIPVVGEIRRGDEPLEGVVVWFGGASGRERTAMRSAEGGFFEGWLPRRGDWFVEVSPSPDCKPCEGGWDRVVLDSVVEAGFFEVEADNDGVARVEIELPAGGIEGRVLRTDRTSGASERVLGARITVIPLESESEGGTRVVPGLWRATSDAEGEYRVIGVPEGAYKVEALATIGGRELRTRGVTARVGESRKVTPVDLRLEEQQRVTMSVRSFGGVPVDSAHVLAKPVGLSRAISVGNTRADGTVELWLPLESRAMDVVVRKRGMGMVAWRFDLNQGPIQVELQNLRGSLRVPRTSSGSIVSPGGVQWSTDHLLTVNGSWQIRVEDDEYVVNELAPGRWTYCLSADACTAGEVTAWSENRLFR